MGALVVGAGGLIGRRLCQELARRETQIIATSRSVADAPNVRGVSWRSVDLATFDGWGDLLKGVSTLYHLAWSTIPSTAVLDPARDVLENVVGTVKMLEAARGVPGLRIVFASSGGSVYGAPEYLPISEDHPTRPISAYGVSKLTVERYIEMYRNLYGVDGMSLRIGNCYGARQHESRGLGAVTLFARAALSGKALQLYGSGEVVRDYVHLDDVVSALIAAGAARRVTGPINVGSGRGHSLKEVIGKLEKKLNRTLEVQHVAPRHFDVSTSTLDIHRASERLGWVPKIDLELGIDLVLAELRADLELECGSPYSSIATTRNISTGQKAIPEL